LPEEFLTEDGGVDQAKVATSLADLRAKNLQQGTKLAALEKPPESGGLKLPDSAAPQTLDQLVQGVGHTHESMAQEWVDNNQSLSDETYAKFQSKGFPKELVNDYYTAKQGQAMAIVQQGDQARQQAVELAGGEEQLSQHLHWARNNYSPAEQQDINNRLANPALTLSAIRQIRADHNDAIGAGNSTPLIRGDGASAGGPQITTKAELQAAQRRAAQGDKQADAAVAECFNSGRMKDLYQTAPMIVGA
jgi:hypothetical protein